MPATFKANAQATGHPRPLLGVIACNRIVGGEIAASVMRRYLTAAATYMDASLVIVPSLPDFIDAPRIASMVDGLLLTGSPSNIASRYYDEPDAEAEGPFDEERDEVVKRMLEAMTTVEKPVLGICRGLQEINVALGGTLRRDLASREGPVSHHAPPDADLDSMFSCSHAVRLVDGGALSRLYGQEKISVNSVHYQGIDRLGSGLTVEATAPDGLVEAISARLGKALLLAVQWHPEWRAGENVQSQALFRAFGDALRGKSIPGLS